MDRRAARRMDRFAQMAVAAARLGLDDAGLDPAEVPDARRVYVGSGIGGLATFVDQTLVCFERGPDRLSPLFIPMMICQHGRGADLDAAGAARPGPVGGERVRDIRRTPSARPSTRSGSGARTSSWRAAPRRRSSRWAIGAFNAMRALSVRNDAPERASRPFDVDRDGFVMGEAGAVLVLEEFAHAPARGARIYAELLGYGLTRRRAPHDRARPDGRGTAGAVRMALGDARVAPDQVGYVNAHATSTPVGDPNEIRAIKLALGEANAARCLVSSTKSMHGHCLGAAGGIEAALTSLALDDGQMPPTINLDKLDPECVGVDHVANVARSASVDFAVSNAFGFGGHNAALVFGRVEPS